MKVVVAPGERSAVGDTVVLLESMKMEIPVLAEHAGTVAAVKVGEGDVVQEGDVLVTIDLVVRPLDSPPWRPRAAAEEGCRSGRSEPP